MQIAEPNAATRLDTLDAEESEPRPHAWSVSSRRWAVRACVLASLIIGSLGALTLIDRRGVIPSGDEPTYLDEAYALGRLHTWNLARVLNTPFASSVNGSPDQLATYVVRHGADFPSHSIGFSALLAPIIAASDSVFSARFGLILVLSVLALWLGEEVVRQSGRRVAWAPIVALVFVTPTYLIASTQIYPDLVSGLILGLIVVRLVRAERGDHVTSRWLLTSGMLLATFTVIDDKNIAITVFLGVMIALVLRHRGFGLRDAALALGPAAAGLTALLAFNLYAYGRGLGPPQPIQPFTLTAVTKFLALLFGKRDGMFVQCPLTLAGVVALARLRRSAPRSTIAAGAAALGLLVGNASVTGAMSGGSFFGRYQWEVFPLLLGFAGVYLVDLWSRRPRIALFAVAAVAALTSWEWVAVASGRPTSNSFRLSGADPASFAGWWGRLDPSPALNYMYGEWQNARVIWGLLFAVSFAAAVIVGLTRWTSSGGSRSTVLPAILAITTVTTGAFALTSPFALPEPVTFIASDLSRPPLPIPATSVTVLGAARSAPVLFGPRLSVLPGRYEAVLTFALTSSNARAAPVSLALTSPGRKKVVSTTFLRPGRVHQQELDAVISKPGTLNVIVFWHGPGKIRIESVTISKLATCSVQGCQGGLF